MSDLTQALGAAGSGRARYAAAMALYREGRISLQVLEVYRIASARDGQDPEQLLAELGLPGLAEPATPEDRIHRLIDEADRYLATLTGPGVAEVRAGLNRWRAGALRLSPRPNAVIAAHLEGALAPLARSHPGLAQAIAAAAPYLTWITYDSYPLEAIGETFAKGHAYASLIGQEGTVRAGDYDLGLFLIAPDILYRDHRHAAPELYVPLTGPHGWRFGLDKALIVKPAHAPVWNDPHRVHMTKVGATPFLALFSWTKDVQQLAEVVTATDWPVLEALRLP